MTIVRESPHGGDTGFSARNGGFDRGGAAHTLAGKAEYIVASRRLKNSYKFVR